ncbi:S41 family peptidase [Deinococcus sp. KSM4-11]|uniref:S41 family peptidase n=1 Tax=Deinococcus sp. KSM4-11 TaxID=2568654 RepID=UPI001F0E22F0|nr:S41 family peptidase [Deinococcus sp. KSM4-11]
MSFTTFLSRLAGRTARQGVVLTVLLGAAAQASPATDLYKAASGDVLREYYGWSTADLESLVGKYRAVLDERCASQAETCPFTTARVVLGELLHEVGDAHTSVRDPDAAKRLDEISRNLPVARTGARVVRVEGGLLVASVMRGSPAADAGLRVHDLITVVNGEVAGKHGAVNDPVGPNEFTTLERDGQALQLTVRRAGEPELALTVGTRELPARDAPTLDWAGDDHRVAVVTIPSFLPTDTADLFLRRVREAQAQGARGLVIDLRFNSGGGLNQCVAAASIFAPVRYRMQFKMGAQEVMGINGETPRRPPPHGSPPPGDARVWTGPAAILIGPDTASCAEVFTFYAQQTGVPAVGEATRGVCNSGVTFDALPDGGVLTVTVLRGFAAEGQPLPERIRPDVNAPLNIAALSTDGRDSTLEAALNVLHAPMGDAPPPPAGLSVPPSP